MQERLAAIVKASDVADDFDPSNLRLVCADLQDAPLPNLSSFGGQILIEPLIENADLIVVDSISTLAGYGRENEAESWLPMQSWALALRRRGKSVLLLHHDGKGGQQRGTSRKEDILDVVIGLRRRSRPRSRSSTGARSGRPGNSRMRSSPEPPGSTGTAASRATSRRNWASRALPPYRLKTKAEEEGMLP